MRYSLNRIDKILKSELEWWCVKLKLKLLLPVLLVVTCLPSVAAPEKLPSNIKLPPGQVALDQPPDLPYLPPFPQADYHQIYSRPNDPGGPGYEIVFFTNSTAPEVLAWYKAAFSRNAWTLEQGSSPKYIAGLRKNTSCSVSALPSWKKKFRTQVVLGYKIFAKETAEEKK